MGQSASEIAAIIREDIVNGRLEPGASLGQAELAERFDVSRLPIRDALAQLAVEGLVDSVPNRGATVLKLGLDDIEEAFDLRELLEIDCLRRTMAVLDESDNDRIAHEAKRCQLEAGRPEFPDADWAFHLALYEPSGRRQAIAMIKNLRQACRSHTATYDRLREQKDAWNDDHDEIVKACRGGDVHAAETALRSHLQRARAALLNAMRI